MNKQTVLYVDDESLNLKSFRMVFGEHFKIYLANSGAEALEILAQESVDVLLSDQRMPDMNGLDLAKLVKDQGYNCVCIILTAFADSDVAMQAINQGGIYRFILKPWDKNELQQALLQAADKFRIEQQNILLLNDLKKKTNELEFFNNELLSVTDQLKEKNEALKTAKLKAEENDSLKTAFLQNMSHEIRTPLNGIIGFAELLSDMDGNIAKCPEYAHLIIESGQRLLNIVNDILDISKIETGQIEIERSKFDLHTILGELYLVYSNKLKDKDISLACHTTENSHLFINSDKTRLYQILSNFLGNATKYTTQGSIDFGYTYTNTGFLDLYVKDTGIGIAHDEKEKIFERFFRSNNDLSKQSAGAGLGLAICDRLAVLLDGEILLESELGEGTQITIRLPQSVIIGEALPTESSEDVPLAPVRGKILIAEDVELNYLYLVELLNGVSVIRATNGEQAIAEVKNDPDICLVLMDLKMPRMDGYTATAEIKKIAPNLPVIAQTAYAMGHDIDKAFSSGVDDYIVKPIQKNELFEKINRHTLLMKNAEH